MSGLHHKDGLFENIFRTSGGNEQEREPSRSLSGIENALRRINALRGILHLQSVRKLLIPGSPKSIPDTLLALLDDRKPGLKPQLNEELINKAYKDALAEVVAEFPKTEFPRSCPYVVDRVVGKEVSELLTR